MQKFFPGPITAWTFCTALVSILAVASYEDVKRMVIPKWLTLSMLGLGILFNVVRGGWVEASGWGAVDGLLCALGGFGTGFGLFLAMWMLGTCGGGDVKLFAALGAWTGALLAIYILIGTLILVVLQSLSKVALAVAAGKQRLSVVPTPSGKSGKRGGNGSEAPKRSSRQRLLTYSLPAALSTACVLLWVYRFELGLAVERVSAEQAHVQARP